MADIYYFQEETLPEWMNPIWEMHKLNSNFYNEFIQYVEDNDHITDIAVLSLMKRIFAPFKNSFPDEETIRDILRVVETQEPNVLNVAMRSTLVTLAVAYAQTQLAAQITNLQSVQSAVYNVPNDIGTTHSDGS